MGTGEHDRRSRISFVLRLILNQNPGNVRKRGCKAAWAKTGRNDRKGETHMRAVVIWLAIILVPISCQAEQAQCNARVLLVGGDTDQFVSTRPSPTAELYNPKTQTFTQLANKPDIYGAAALLPNGRVLIIGQGMAELYRPQRHDFISAGTPLDARHNAAIGLANGNVLLYSETSPQCFPQLSCEPSSNTAEIYDWKTETFTMVKSSVGLVVASVLLNNGLVLLAGDDLELYRPHRNNVITAIALDKSYQSLGPRALLPGLA
jgi:hypothetical protein